MSTDGHRLSQVERTLSAGAIIAMLGWFAEHGGPAIPGAVLPK